MAPGYSPGGVKGVGSGSDRGWEAEAAETLAKPSAAAAPESEPKPFRAAEAEEADEEPSESAPSVPADPL